MLWQVELRGDPSWCEGLYCGGPEAILWGGCPHSEREEGKGACGEWSQGGGGV